MKNKIKLKKSLNIILLFSIISLFIFIILNIYEYTTYRNEVNLKLNNIIYKIKEEYPNIKDKDIISIINGSKSNDTILRKYGIFIENDYVIKSLNNKFNIYLIINTIYLSVAILIIIIIFLLYDKRLDKDISNITNYIEQINKKNYNLELDDLTEDELSILKNEIYKTTIMLKESADNSLKDKIELKKSLEDISHQIKTPLTSILIMLDSIIDDPTMDNNTKLDFIINIKREVGNINFLIQSLLKLTKFDVNTIKFTKKSIFVNDLINDSIKNISTICDLKNIKINVSGNNNIKLKCDYMWQKEALTNIIKNSIEHSKENSNIDINYEENNAYISITIKDYGIGINKNDLPHIFKRFYKSVNSTNESMGIGLALSKAIIEKENGTIDVKSKINETIFIIKYYKI